MTRLRQERALAGAPAGGERTFAEIGRALGITKGGAWMLYRSAIRKLRKSGHMKMLRELAMSKEAGSGANH